MDRKTICFYACGLPIVLYILTAARTLPWGDGVEFYVAVRNLGIPHPSGYPLFLMLGRALYMFSTSPFLLNLLPGLITVFTLFFLYRIILHFTDEPLIGLVLALFFATGREVWQQSVVAEVYTLNMCLFVVLLSCVLEAQKNERFVIPAFFVIGLALTNHLTSLLYVLPCGAFLIARRPRSARYALIALVPLLLYAYFPIRSHADPIPDLFNPETFGDLITYVSGRSFLYRTFSIARPLLASDILAFLRSWWWSCLVLLPLGFYGLVLLRKARLRILFIGMCVLMLGYTLLYDIPDKQGYYLPFYAAWFVLIALALVKLLPAKLRPALLLLPIISIALHYRSCDRSHDTSLDDLGAALFAALPDQSIVFSDDYFVHYDMINRIQSSTKNIIPINQFYLRMDWYINNLTERYPDLIVPGSVMRLLAACNRTLKDASPTQYGDISEQCCLSVQHEIVQANIDTRPVCWFMYDDGHWPQRSYDLFLQFHGLYYQYRKDSLTPVIFELHVPSPEQYQADKLVHEDAVYVAKKFAAAYNRRGICRSLHEDIPGAIDDLFMALRYYPAYYQVYANLGIIHLNAGDTARTRGAWQAYLDQAPTGPQRERIRTWYDALQKE